MKPSEALRNEIVSAAANKGHKTQADLAAVLAITPQYLCDILRNRKRLTPQLVSLAANMLAVHPVRYRRWHRLGAMESGWEIDSRQQVEATK